MEHISFLIKTIWEDRQRQVVLGLCLFLIISIAAVYGQTAWFDFIAFDDSIYVSNNPMVPGGLTWAGIKWAFTTMHGTNWFPLVWLSLMADKQFFGADAGAFHFVNVVFHTANALLLFWVLKRYTKALWASFFVAAFFAFHPLHVESVAWVAERKDVLSTLFWLLTMLAYLRYVERLTVWRYAMVLICFSLGLMSKPMLVTLPFVLLIMDYWPLCRLWTEDGIAGVSVGRLLFEKAPLFILSAASSVLTVIAQRPTVATLEFIPMSYRLSNTPVAYCGYILKMFWPLKLAVFYPHPGSGLAGWSIAASSVALLAITVIVVLFRRRRYLLAGWLWYLGTLIPVIGLVQVGRQALADRYTYIPLTGLFIMLVWSAGDIISKWRHRTAVTGIWGTALVAALGVLTFRQVGFWRDTVTLFTHTAAVTTNNVIVHNALGIYYSNNDDYDRAMQEFKKAIDIDPGNIITLCNTANSLARQGRKDEATELYNQVLKISPDDPLSYLALGSIETDKSNLEGAIDLYRTGLKYHPEDGKFHGRIGVLLLKMGQVDEAIAVLETAAKLEADSSIYGNLGLALAAKGQVERAIECYKKAIWMNPANAEAHYNLGNTYLAQDRIAEAAGEYKRAIKAKPEYSKAYANLGIALSWMGRTDEGIDNFRRAAEIDPDNVEAHFNLASALADKGLFDEAIAEFERGLQIDPNDTTAKEAIKKIKEAKAGSTPIESGQPVNP